MLAPSAGSNKPGVGLCQYAGHEIVSIGLRRIQGSIFKTDTHEGREILAQTALGSGSPGIIPSFHMLRLSASTFCCYW